ncbi:FkbM family methyltransferase [Limobrevibacterium gyesilva]|uniref:FkbM family methyltransferase n=1 Tax=Limobrevibacterium gyesilva TaxID=2991712 RepID=A0AA41YMC7_9PROT|nr:FkbM family methyltransferase [Limobrevibacterium gyesilva]MCW3474967.1 FkbM family methyltransferase [Limobrevibacterium gyesilva]
MDLLVSRLAKCGAIARRMLVPVDGIRLLPAGARRWRVATAGRWADVRMRAGTTDLAVFFQVFVALEYRLSNWGFWGALSQAYARILADGKRPLIVDCGANIGLSSVYFRLLFPDALICAVEPEPGNDAALRANVAGLGIEALNVAVHHRPAAVRMVDPGTGQWGFRTVETAAADAAVRAVSVPEILALPAFAGAVPFLIKVDIEGFEAELFAADFGWIDLFPLLVIELHDWLLPGQASSRSFVQALAGSAPRDLLFRRESVFSVRSDMLRPDGAARG